jgi:DNA-binding NtrC family response regulator
MATILLVEDSDLCAHLFRRALEKAGYDVVVAMTASDARDELAKQPFAAAVVDTQLPDGDGTTLPLECPRVIMSADSGPGVFSKASGAAQLVAAVRHAIEGSQPAERQ